MAHLIEKMAYVGSAPWHQLGSQLPPKQPIELWAQSAGMNWEICETPVRYASEEGSAELLSYPEQKVLYRSDTKRALSVVSQRYQVVQPKAVLEFYRDLTQISGYELETAGVLKEGKKFWALAKIGKEAALKGGDVVRGYLLLATSCDGTLATTATPTTVRVVCNNTLTIALNEATPSVRVPHSTVFDAEAVKQGLGVAVSHWDEFMHRMKELAGRKVRGAESAKYFRKVLGATPAEQPATDQALLHERALRRLQELYDGHGRGAELAAAKGSAWGLLNAVTEYVDHERRARTAEYRLDSAWFGQGAAIKQRALTEAVEMLA